MQTATKIIWGDKRKHLPQIVEIERACFQYPWLEEDFAQVWRHPFEKRVAICRSTKRVIGYLFFQRNSVTKIMELINLAVHPDHRRQGIAFDLLQNAALQLEQMGLKKIWAFIPDYRLPAHLTFKKAGFLAVDVVPHWKSEVDEYVDHYLFEYWCPEHKSKYHLTNRIANLLQ